MKPNLTFLVGWLFLIVIFGFYIYGIADAIILSISEKTDKFSEFVATTISSMQALLLTNLGALLGVSVARPQSAVARNLFLGQNATTELTEEEKDPLLFKEKVQMFALTIFMLSLIACLVTWIIKEFNPEAGKVVPVVVDSCKVFVAVGLAYVALFLAKKQ